MEDTRISIEGDIVRRNGRFLSYTPVRRKSVSTLLLFEAHNSFPTGRPARLAKYPARISPKLPVGTEKSTRSPGAMAPARRSWA